MKLCVHNVRIYTTQEAMREKDEADLKKKVGMFQSIFFLLQMLLSWEAASYQRNQEMGNLRPSLYFLPLPPPPPPPSSPSLPPAQATKFLSRRKVEFLR